MLNQRERFWALALVLVIGLVSGCGGGSGTDNDKPDLVVCDNFEVVLPDGTCGEPLPPPPCPEGQIRVGGKCIVPDKPQPVYIPEEDEVVIYINSEDKDFSKYNLHLWQSCGNGWGDSVTDGKGDTYAIPTTWPAGPYVTSQEGEEDPIYGAYFVIPTSEAGTCGNFIIKNVPAQTNDLSVNILREGGPYDRMYFVIINTADMRASRTSASPICINDICQPYEEPALAISDVAAHWIDAHTIVWSRDLSNVKLYWADNAGMTANDDGSVANATGSIELGTSQLMSEGQQSLVPHLDNYSAYPVSLNDDPAAHLAQVKSLLKKELLIVGEDDTGRLFGTRIQTAKVLDAVYTQGEADADEQPLGVSYTSGVGVSVWAPTASNVELRIFDGNPLRVVDTKTMIENTATGIWSYQGSAAELDRKFYRFRVTGYNPFTKAVEQLEVTDPYSVSLSSNSKHSQFVNLADADLKPAGWDGHTVPEVAALEAMSIYEMHIRDFSIDDASTQADYRGKYLAFTDSDSAPVVHLKALQEAGLTHVHLLPSNDSSTVEEESLKQINLDSTVLELCDKVNDEAIVCDGAAPRNATLRSVLESYDPLSDNARSLINSLANYDGFNWGYDPQHFNAPEGSYATSSNGVARILEMRAMNKALHDMGLRVVLDVVYPHTISAGIEAGNSVFDKIVPGYYYRFNPISGAVETGTFAGPDTATENRMMAKFVTDSVVQWAKEYGFDGFRFDQSGYMPKSVLIDAYEAVKAVDEDNYFYAEAWTPAGGTSGDRIFERATQEALAGTGIGTFNDRMRNPLQQLQLIKGSNVDAIRAGLAGNLRDFQLKTKAGTTIKAQSVGAYNLDPQEAVNYVEKHDNETLWDWIHRPDALPEGTSLDNRVRIHNLTLSMPVLSQGVPFIHMGSDMLRSKSMSPNSYNAGDWFNRVDFTKQSNNWAVGLPPELRDGVTDEYVAAQFADPASKPLATHIEMASAVFNEFMGIASGSPLFSLQTAEEVMDRVGFHDGGKTQVAGLIVMSIDDGVGTVAGTSTARADLDTNVDAIVVVINGSNASKSTTINTSTGFVLHSALQNSADALVRTSSFAEGENGGTFTVPAYTTAVFVKPQAGAQGEGLSATATTGVEVPVPYGDTAIYVRGEVTEPDWSVADASNRLVYKGDGIYSVNITLTAGSYSFKVASEDWSTVDKGAPDGTTVTLGSAVTMNGGSNLSITIPLDGTYRFELDATNAATPSLTVTDTDVFRNTAIYARGEITNPAWSTADASNQLIHEGDSVYSVTLALEPGTYQFKVASADWSTVDRGVSAADTSVTLGTEKLMDGGSNAVLVIPTAGNYKFQLNAKNPATPTIKVFDQEVFKGTAVYVRGSFNGWGTGNELVYQGDGIYSTTISLTAQENNYEFKVASEDWSTVDRGITPANPVVVVDTPTALQVGGAGTDTVNAQVNIDVTGSYVFELDTADAEAPILTIKPE